MARVQWLDLWRETGPQGGCPQEDEERETEPAGKYKKRPEPLSDSDLCALTGYASFMRFRVYAVRRARRHVGLS